MQSAFQSTLQKLGNRVFLKGAVLIAVLICIGVLAKQLNFRELLESFEFSAAGDRGILHGPFGFMLFAAGLSACGAPRQVISFFAAYFFGIWLGFAVALLATMLGCILDYLFASLFNKMVRKMITGKTDVVLKFWAENPFSVTMLIRFLPIGSNLITSLTAGATGISALWFFAGTAIGYVPQTLVFAIMGAGVNVGSNVQIAVSIALFVVSALLGLWIYARNRRLLSNNATTAEL